MFRTFLKCRGKGVDPRSEEQFASFGSTGIDQLHRSYAVSPFVGKHLSKFFFTGQQVRHCEVVLAENAPDSTPCEQVTGIIDGPKYLPESTKQSCLFLPRAPSNPAKDSPIVVFILDKLWSSTFVASAHGGMFRNPPLQNPRFRAKAEYRQVFQ
jgi:hypothetical protein